MVYIYLGVGYSQYQQKVVLLSRTEALNKNEPKDIEYMPHRLDKYIFKLISIKYLN